MDSSELGLLIAKDAADALLLGYEMIQLKQVSALVPEGDGIRSICEGCVELAKRVPQAPDTSSMEYAVMLAAVACYLVQAPKTSEKLNERCRTDLGVAGVPEKLTGVQITELRVDRYLMAREPKMTREGLARLVELGVRVTELGPGKWEISSKEAI